MGGRVNLFSPGILISIDFSYQQETKNKVCLPGTEELLFCWNHSDFGWWTRGQAEAHCQFTAYLYPPTKIILFAGCLKNKALPSVS